MKQHELGHQFFNRCLDFPSKYFTINIDCVCETNLEKKYIKKRDQLINDFAQQIGSLLDSQRDLFHSIYGNSGYAESYTCPSK